ncbi:unnamed protein product [Meloidogyne enterolobii]|uniref:Uncharacterized protein n=1 Tax=Meloidogyne enterolobii TaxID=390850 RepID=A0ACB0ZNY2_MELEN
MQKQGDYENSLLVVEPSVDKSKVADTVSDVCKEMRASELKLRSAEQIIREKEREIARYKFADRIRAVIVSGDTPKASDIAEMERILEVWKSSLVPTTNEYGVVPGVQRENRR